MKYYIIAGEASGDLHASNLIRELKKLDPEADFRCWGGDRMMANGAVLAKHIRETAYMGFVEVAVNLGTIMGNIRFCKKDILAYGPDVLILVDYPGFNLRIAEFAKEQGLRVFYYISPQVWAWKQGRVKTISRVVDRMYVILPFEEDFYKKFGYRVDFVGHPLLDAVENFRQSAAGMGFRNETGLGDKPIVAMLPGSRRQEIRNMLGIMLSVVPRFPDHTFVIAAVPDIPESFYRTIIKDSPIKLVTGRTYDLLSVACAAMVTSGTATLETALFGVPEVVCYKGSRISVAIARKVVRIKYISLVNLILDRHVVREFIQKDLNTGNLAAELGSLMAEGEYRSRILKDLEELKIKLGGAGASEKTARLMTEHLKEKL
jgi:lipid-A-disaccharide synthase